MFIHDLAFWAAVFFLLGVFFASFLGNFLMAAILGLLIFSYFLIFKNYWLASLSLLIIAGVFYYQAFDYFQSPANIVLNVKTEFAGVVQKIEQSSSKQGIVLKLEPPHSGKIKINARPYPVFNYGDRLKIFGIIKEPLPESRAYLAKDGIFGTASFPEIEFLESGRGNFIKSRLLSFKTAILGIFKRFLPSEQAALLAGLTLGEREGFSKELKDQMALSGTTHIVALSGYNISVISLAVISLFSIYFSRSISFYLSVLVIILFVLMAGAEASVVRAAIMGIIAIMAKESERIFSIRNAIIIAAFLMVLHNPKVLVFDLGFQLSFAALLGIVYLLPVLKKIFIYEQPGFLNWKENSLTTLSAQLAVIPFLLSNFGIFSLTSLVSNVLIAEAIPITMALGFIMAGFGFISEFLAQATGLIVNLFLSYELWIIDVFSKITLPIVTQSFDFFLATGYYLLLILFIYKFNK